MRKILFIGLLLAVPAALRPEIPYFFPSLQDENDPYTRFGWTWTAADLPDDRFADCEPSYTAGTDDIHGDTEADDLWVYTIQYLRTGLCGYRDRMLKWAAWMRDVFPTAVQTQDEAGFYLCHIYVHGLLTYYEYTGDVSYKTAAETIGDLIVALYKPAAQGGTGIYSNAAPGVYKMAHSMRGPARQLLCIARLYEHNPARYGPTLARMLDLWEKSPDFLTYGPSGGGLYMAQQDLADDSRVCGPGPYANGARIQAAFWLGLLGEAFWHAYRVQPQRTFLRDRLLSMGRFIKDYGLDYSFSPLPNSWTYFGVNINTGQRVGCQGSQYSTISLVNLLAFASWFAPTSTEQNALMAKAKEHLEYGTRWYDCINGATQPAGQVAHFLDSEDHSATGFRFLCYNKSELQYAWAIFADPDSVLGAARFPSQASAAVTLESSPNPVRAFVTIRLRGYVGHAELSVYNLKGERICALKAGLSGQYQWRPAGVPCGVYVVRAAVPGRSFQKNITLLR